MKQTREGKKAVPLAKKGMKRNNQTALAAGKVRVPHNKKSNNITAKGDQKMETTGFKAFEMKNVSEDVFRFIKFSLDTTFENIAKMQEFNEKLVRDTIEAGKKAQAEAEKIVNETIDNTKKGWDEYRKAVESGFKKVEEMIQPSK